MIPGAEWLEPLCRHISDRYEHLVRYLGWYSNRVRGQAGEQSAARREAARERSRAC
ncbi:MAG: hypothetical protein ACREU4_00710 [Burkholderiales bacterium]